MAYFNLRWNRAVATYQTVAAVTTQVLTPYVQNESPLVGEDEGAILVTLADDTSGATIRYTIDNTSVTEDSPEYTAPFVVSSGTTFLRAAAFKTGMVDSDEMLAIYIIGEVADKVATPTFSPTNGNFASTVTVTLTCATVGADMYYTLDGTTPSILSFPYTVPFNLAATTQVKAIGIKSGLTDSNVASKTYTKTSAAEAVYWGPTPLRVLTEADVLALANTSLELDFFRTYPFGGTVADYFAWWSPDVFAVPRLTDGFYLAPFPVSMATPSEGYVDGPTNGWYYYNLTVNGVPGKVFATFFQLGSGSTQNIVVQ
jgi:hypothetical protein